MTAAAMVPACSWNTPGRHPYRGTAMEAVSRYTDIPAATRHLLVAKIDSGNADDDVVITRDTVEGRASYHAAITDMHFGRQTICEQVSRERWPVTAREPAKVYCADGHCLIVPRICNNISRIRQAGGGTSAGAAGPGVHDASYTPRGAPIPLPAGAPEVDIAATDAMAQLSSGAPPDAGAPVLSGPFGGWPPGFSMGNRAMPDTGVPSTVPLSPVPEPAGWVMFLVGAAGVVVYSRFRK